MYDAEVGERLLRTCDYRFPTLICPRKKKIAEITAVRWQVRNNHWTPLRVIDCNLLPAGQVWCDQSCLLFLENHRN